MGIPLVLKLCAAPGVLVSPSPSQQNPDPRFYQQVGERSKKLTRHKLAMALNDQNDDISERIRLFRELAPQAHNDPITPGFEPKGQEPVEDRPELNHLKRFRSQEGDGYSRSRQAAQILIDGSLQPQSFEEWRQNHMNAIPGPGIAAPAQDPGEIRW